tara:strand:+ start:4570 stop:5145 length:576 start_codon:yes stop_codon:yes gene_type:complete
MKRFFYFKLFLFIFLSIQGYDARATLVFKGSGGYTTFDHSESEIAYSRMQGSFFVGAGIGRNAYIILGPSYSLWNKSHKPASSTAEEVAITEFGATLLIYFSRSKNWKFEVTYCPNITGTRTTSGTEEDLLGSSYSADFGYHMNLTETFILGASIGYHSTTLSQKIVSNTESTISESYTQIIPKLEVALRF